MRQGLIVAATLERQSQLHTQEKDADVMASRAAVQSTTLASFKSSTVPNSKLWQPTACCRLHGLSVHNVP